MLLVVEFELMDIWLASEVILVDMLVVEGAGIYLEKLIARGLILDEGMIGQSYIMNGDILHFDLMFVVGCWKRIVQLAQFSPEVAAA